MLGGFLFTNLSDGWLLPIGSGFHPDPYQVLFFVSFEGRALTVFWIVPLHEPPSRDAADVEQVAATADNSD